MFTNKITHVALFLLFIGSLPPAADGENPTDPWRSFHHLERHIPNSSNHPGNIFLENEIVVIPINPKKELVNYRVTDVHNRQVAKGSISGREQKTIELGKLGIGWYRITWLDALGNTTDQTTAAVIARLNSPVPQNSPICIDSATCWFAKGDRSKQQAYAQLAALAGVNWIRDRIRRRDLQPHSDQFSDETQYDDAAKIQSQNGLKILQVHHDTPAWASSSSRGSGRFPTDLRDAYRFGKAMSARFKHTVQAWEPWNEANVANFGGHTMDEICSLQKAAYLGYKAGNPQATVCWNVTTGVPTKRQTECVLENETWPYFDTYNIHTYDWPHSYRRLWKPVRNAASGKPIWVTESDRGIPIDPDSPYQDLSPENDLLKAHFIAQSYASSLHAGANRHFHFILGQYSEGTTQFGLLRHDLTPRPSYVALAATGRFLAGARCLGKLVLENQPNVHVIAFRALSDGKPRDVLVAWAEKQSDWSDRGKYEVDWPFDSSLTIETCYDFLGRLQTEGAPIKLTSAPQFIVLPAGQADQLSLHLPKRSIVRPGVTSPIVLQCLLPKESSKQDKSIRWASQFEHTILHGIETEIPIYVYNFSDRQVKGNVSIERVPTFYHLEIPHTELQLAPMDRKRLTVKLKMTERAGDQTASNWIKFRGEFGTAGRPVLAFRMMPITE